MTALFIARQVLMAAHLNQSQPFYSHGFVAVISIPYIYYIEFLLE